MISGYDIISYLYIYIWLYTCVCGSVYLYGIKWGAWNLGPPKHLI
jgi:hypothetical protein